MRPRPMNGNTTERQRNSDGCTVLACGCAHTESRWLEAHFTEWSELHQAAATAHAATLQERLP
jgi:hypothetical protein